jgi:ADP-ribose pyrophosphatase YjhB (NUDIX family)
VKRDYPDRPIVGVGAVVVSDGRALVVRRATEPLKGQWSIPGGMLELGEKLREGIAREVLEETGLEVEVFDVLDVFDSIFPDLEGRTQYHYVLIDFLCRPKTTPLKPKEGEVPRSSGSRQQAQTPAKRLDLDGVPEARVAPELRAGSDVSEAKWVSAEEAAKLEMKAVTVGVIRKALGV